MTQGLLSPPQPGPQNFCISEIPLRPISVSSADCSSRREWSAVGSGSNVDPMWIRCGSDVADGKGPNRVRQLAGRGLNERPEGRSPSDIKAASNGSFPQRTNHRSLAFPLGLLIPAHLNSRVCSITVAVPAAARIHSSCTAALVLRIVSSLFPTAARLHLSISRHSSSVSFSAQSFSGCAFGS